MGSGIYYYKNKNRGLQQGSRPCLDSMRGETTSA